MVASMKPAFTCPRCSADSYGREKTRHAARAWLYRRRECEHCGARYSTREVVVSGSTQLAIGDDASETLERVRDVVGR